MTVLVDRLREFGSEHRKTGADVALNGEGCSTESSAVSARRAGWLERFEQNPWRKVALKMLGVAVGLAVLCVVGVWSFSVVPRNGPRSPDDYGRGTWLASNEGSIGAAPRDPLRFSAASSGALPVGSASAATPTPQPEAIDAGSAPAETPSAVGVTPDGRVILNAASASELTRLPGVGDKRAEAIVQLRRRLGRFRTAAQLLRIRGIGPKTLRKMLPHLVVDAPAPPDDEKSARGQRGPG